MMHNSKEKNKGKRKETITAILAEQGYGTKKECARMVWAGLVEKGYANETPTDWIKVVTPDEAAETQQLFLKVNGAVLPYLETVYLAFHKPVNTECSHAPSHHQSIFAYFPEQFVTRGLEAVGRLDADTTGLLLLSDSGGFNHFFTSPKKHISKTYRVGMKHSITSDQIERLEKGVQLKSEETVTLPAKLILIDDTHCDLTIEEGKYHQVKRMFAAVSNRVESIHRIAIGKFELPTTLKSGEWKILTPDELSLLDFKK